MDMSGDERGSECHVNGHTPHEKEAVVVWTCEKEMREAASVMSMDTHLTRRRLPWYGHVRRR